MVAERATEEIAGVVACVNEKGLKLRGADSWINFSKWAKIPVLPAVGASVVITVDSSGFARSLMEVQPSEPQQARQDAPQCVPAAQGSVPGKDVQIARMNALTHAVALLSLNGTVPATADVLVLAGELEAWVCRS